MSGITTHKYGDESINAAKFTAEVKKGLYAYYNADHMPSLSAPNGYGDPTGTTGDTNRMVCSGSTFPVRSHYHVKGTQTLLGPLLDTTGKGLDVSQDQTDNDGAEHFFGALNTRGAFTYTVGTDNAFIRVKFRIADVSGTDDCAIGFRKNEAFQANIDDYDEAAWVNVILGAIKTETILNNAATVTTDSGQTWADDATHELEVKLIGRRVSYWLDGAPLPGTVEYNFDNAEVVGPFWFFLQATTTPGKVWWTELEFGKLMTINSNGSPS